MGNRKSRRAMDPFAMRVKFERTRLKKAIKHARQALKPGNSGMAGDDDPPHGPDAMAAMSRSILDSVINAIRRYLWCRDAAEALDNGIKFLQDNEDQLSEKQKEDFRKDLAGLLDNYSDIC